MQISAKEYLDSLISGRQEASDNCLDIAAQIHNRLCGNGDEMSDPIEILALSLHLVNADQIYQMVSANLMVWRACVN